MINSKLLLVTALFSFSAFAVTMEEKINRIEFLEALSNKSISMDVDAYRRDIQYDKQGLSLNNRASHEARILAEKIRLQVQIAYDAALKDKTSEEAFEEIRNEIDKDLELVSPDLQIEFRELAMSALEQADKGSTSSLEDLSGVQKTLLKDIKARADYLNMESDNSLAANYSNLDNRNNDKVKYKNKAEVIESLVSAITSIKSDPSSGVNISSTETSTSGTTISVRVQARFLGVEVNAGPLISFKREYKTRVNIQAEGLYPVISADGNFDLFKRDSNGKRLVSKRKVTIACDANLSFESDYSGGGGFSVAGVGVSSSVSKKYSNSVGLVSRRILLPESVDNKSLTYKDLMNLCHNDFLKAQVTNVMTIEKSLNVMMKNVASSVTFSHPKSKCAVDNHCLNWYNREVIGLLKIKNTPRCAEERTEKYKTCELRGLKGQNCTLVDKKGKRTTSGSFEFTCDRGLSCVQVKEGGWFKNMQIHQYAVGKCLPTNPKTYKKPVY